MCARTTHGRSARAARRASRCRRPARTRAARAASRSRSARHAAEARPAPVRAAAGAVERAPTVRIYRATATRGAKQLSQYLCGHHAVLKVRRVLFRLSARDQRAVCAFREHAIRKYSLWSFGNRAGEPLGPRSRTGVARDIRAFPVRTCSFAALDARAARCDGEGNVSHLSRNRTSTALRRPAMPVSLPASMEWLRSLARPCWYDFLLRWALVAFSVASRRARVKRSERARTDREGPDVAGDCDSRSRS